MFSSYSQAVDALYRRINFESLAAGKPGGYSSGDFKLDRMRNLLEALDSPHEKIPAVHVAGTKGKGTTCTLVASILQEAGYRIGLFTSPHMYRIEERFQVNGQSPTPLRFTQMVNQLMPFLDKLDGPESQLNATFFEIINAIAWLYFLEEEVDIVVLETGLGGRLDSTIFCQPLVTAITSISLDHTKILGETIGEIAREKAGILKTGIPLVSGVLDPQAQQTIHEIAIQRDCPVVQLGRDFDYQTKNNWTQNNPVQQVQFDTKPADPEKELSFTLKQPGSPIAQNASLAVSIIQQLPKQKFNVSSQNIQRAICDVVLPLRFEILEHDPVTVVDSAHNQASIEAVIETAHQIFPGKFLTVILSVSHDKDYLAICRKLQGVDLVIVTNYLGNQRALSIGELKRAVLAACDANVMTANSPAEAWILAQQETVTQGVILATGSLFLAAEVRELVLQKPGSSSLT
ncbi:MAG: bifunctional folylpolyglutamate synthase/dihydrofolate synthase [Planctomycetaceae bacterium]|nr:bifunctional folylpolyglutamate synthase/dihydrofolate synthase [Planctomycetaceae bacterium]